MNISCIGVGWGEGSKLGLEDGKMSLGGREEKNSRWGWREGELTLGTVSEW